MSGTSRLQVAIAQTNSVLGDIAANIENHRHYIDQARSAGDQLLVFPETSLTGYHLGTRVPEVAMRRDDPRLAALSAAAPDLDIVVGFVEEGPAAQFYNAAALLRGGRVAFVHRKVNLPTYGNLAEGKMFAAGGSTAPVALDGPWTASLLICADLWNPALVHLAAMQAATLLIAPINSAVDAVSEEFSNPHGWAVAVEFYAMMYGLPVVMANRVGLEGNARFWGGSRIIDPQGALLAEAPRDVEAMIRATLDYGAVRNARFQLPTVRDANPRLVAGELQRILHTP